MRAACVEPDRSRLRGAVGRAPLLRGARRRADHGPAAAGLVDRPLANLEAAGAHTWPGTPGSSPTTLAATAARTGRSGAAAYDDAELVADARRGAGRGRGGLGGRRGALARCADPASARRRPSRPGRRRGLRRCRGRPPGPAGSGARHVPGRARQLRGLAALERAPLAPGPGRVRGVLLRRGVPGAALDPSGRGRRGVGARDRRGDPGRHPVPGAASSEPSRRGRPPSGSAVPPWSFTGTTTTSPR